MRTAEAATVSTATRASATLVMTDMASALRRGVARLITPEDRSGVKRACARDASTPVSSLLPGAATLNRSQTRLRRCRPNDLRKGAPRGLSIRSRFDAVRTGRCADIVAQFTQ